MIEYLSGVFSYVGLILLIGLGPSLMLRNVLGIKSIFNWLVFSLVLGLLINSFTLLVIGSFGFEVLGESYWVIMTILIGLSIFLLLIVIRNNKWRFNNIKAIKMFDEGTDLIDIAIYMFFTIFFLYIILMNAKMFLYQTDELRFWLVDTKIIFNNGFLRTDGRVISNNAYSSFMPIHFVQIYNLFGRVVEQYAAVISIIYLYLGSVATYIYIRRYLKESRILTFFAILVVILVLGQQVFFAYADITLFFFILFSTSLIPVKVKKEDYSKKIFILLLSIFATSFVKLPVLQFSPYSVIIFTLWIIYDRKVLRSYFSEFRKWRLQDILLILLPFIILIANWYYRSYVLTDIPFYHGEAPSVTRRFMEYFAWMDLGKTLTYPAFLFEFMWDIHRVQLLFYMTLWALFTAYLYYGYRKGERFKHLSKNKKILLYSALVCLFPLLNFVYYAIIYRRTQMERYLAASIFVAVLLYAELYKTKFLGEYEKYKKLLFVVFILLIAYGLPGSYLARNALFVADVTGGSYANFERFKEKAENAEDVLKIIGDEKIIIAKFQIHCLSKTEHCVLNTTNKVNQYKYFLQENQEGRLFSVSAKDLPEYLKEEGVNYLLVSVGFAFAQEFDTEGDYDKFVHLYKFNPDEGTFEYIKGYEDYKYVE